MAPIVFSLNQGFTGHADLHVRWTDSLGRVVEDETSPADLIDETSITFPIDLTHAVAMKNHLHVEVSLRGKDIHGAPLQDHESADADFTARPPYSAWNDYVIMMWQPYPSPLIPDLQKLGINGGQYSGRSSGLPDFLIGNNMRWYSESLAPQYYSAYHRWRADRPVGWSFTQAKELYKKDPNSLEAFKRHPSFEDPYWRKLVHDRGVATAERNSPYRPYFYSLSDESGIGELEAQWDFDFSDESLVPMRRWLQSQYGSLGTLNREWGTNFTDWDLVIPETTDQAMIAPGDNFAAWADFKEWMDISYADALKMGADAIREGDPQAYVAIGGGQMPGWGGYDYSRITEAITAIEPYDIGRSVDIVHSLRPSMPIMSTGFASGRWEEHRVWYELLHGNSGLIVWDENHGYVQPDGKAGARGEEAASYYREIRDGEGALIINSHLVNDRIAIHYSQPSLRTQWMLERRPDGEAWMTRSASYERSSNHFMRLRESWCNLLADEGMQYRFVSYQQVAGGALLQGGYPVVILPESSSLSAEEAAAIREFVAAGGIAIADGVPGTYDEHSRRLVQSPLDDLFGEKPAQQVNVRSFGMGKAVLLNVDVTAYLQDRLDDKEGPLHTLIEKLLTENDVRPQFSADDGSGHPVVGVDLHVFANGGVRILSLQSNPQLRVDELGPPDFRTNQRFERPIAVHLHLPAPMYLYDTRARKSFGLRTEIALTLDPYQPTILAASYVPLPPMQVAMPDHASPGSAVRVAVRATAGQAAVNVFHIDVLNPKGERIDSYSGNLIVRQGSGMKQIPLAVNDPSGRWTVTVHDLLSGQVISRVLTVNQALSEEVSK